MLRKTIILTYIRRMSYNKLGIATDRFSVAIKHALGALPKESIIEYFASTSDIDLEEILSISEQMEEYELCDVIAKALKQRNLFCHSRLQTQTFQLN